MLTLYLKNLLFTLKVCVFLLTGTLNKESHMLSDSTPDLEGQGRDSRDSLLWRRAQGTHFDQRLSREF